MKAILVIDMPENNAELFRNTFGIYLEEFWSFTEEQMLEFINKKPLCPLKPIPQKRETQVHWKSIGGGDIPTHEITDYDKGWNDCVEMLEGENYE